jgi:hypothetical protein
MLLLRVMRQSDEIHAHHQPTESEFIVVAQNATLMRHQPLPVQVGAVRAPQIGHKDRIMIP